MRVLENLESSLPIETFCFNAISGLLHLRVQSASIADAATMNGARKEDGALATF